jgi:integrating conjugative element protein (TIGR03758 family)
MDPTMSAAFEVGSGVSPTVLRTTVLLIASGVIVMVFAWTMLGIFNAYKEERATLADATWAALKVVLFMSFLFYAVFR